MCQQRDEGTGRPARRGGAPGVATYACTSHCSNIVWHCDSTILYCTSHFHICLSTTPTSGSPCTRASSAVFTVVSPATSEFEGQNLSWKQRYAEARGRWCQSVMYGQRFVDPQCYLRLLPRKMFTVTYLDSSLVRGRHYWRWQPLIGLFMMLHKRASRTQMPAIILRQWIQG
jgi:hypothetical protein